MVDDMFKDDGLIEHAERCWKAECENAERLSGRVRLLTTGAAALFGIGAFKIELFRSISTVETMPPGAGAVVKALLTLAVVAFAASFALILFPRAPRGLSLHASERLVFDKVFIANIPAESLRRRMEVFVRTVRAALDLKDRNNALKRQISRAQTAFAIGMALVMTAILVYTWTASASVTEGVEHGQPTESSERP